MTTLGAIHHGDIDRITDAAMNDAINVCNTGEGYCRRCHADRGLGVQGTCRLCRLHARHRPRCLYCGLPMQRGVLRECFGDHEQEMYL
jgi:hypothetical protein